MTMRPIDSIRDAKAIIAELAQRFPKAFVVFEKRRRPLKIGIDRDIAAAAPDIDATDLSNALGYYTRNLHYLNTLVAGAPRIGLDGEVCGDVSEKDAASAGLRFANILKRQAARRQASASSSNSSGSNSSGSNSGSNSGSSSGSPSLSSAKRDGLAELRAARLRAASNRNNRHEPKRARPARPPAIARDFHQGGNRQTDRRNCHDDVTN
jgi:sRNA-binding protein